MIAIATLVGFGALWPRGAAPDLGTQPGNYVDATVVSTERTTCDAVEAEALAGCSAVEVEITSGDDAGDTGVFLVRDTDFRIPEMQVGDRVVLLDVPTSPPPFRYTYSDVQRSTPMWWLLALFVVAVIAVGRWQGARALAGLAISGLILVLFVVPSLLRDESAVLVALTGTVRDRLPRAVPGARVQPRHHRRARGHVGQPGDHHRPGAPGRRGGPAVRAGQRGGSGVAGDRVGARPDGACSSPASSSARWACSTT